MTLHRAFRLFVIINIIFCTSFSPLAAVSIEVSNTEAPTATTREVCAACTYISIQDAIDVSDPGDIIDLYSETYTETITINEDNYLTRGGT